jgi:hypothetical protein
MRRFMWLMAFMLLPSTVAQAEPVVTLGATTVQASGLTKGGRAAWLAVAHDYVRIRPEELRWHQLLTDSDADTEVTLEIGRSVPLRSTWICVDVETGDFGVQTPDPTNLREVDPRGPGLVEGEQGWEFLSESRSTIDILLVRPGQSAWAMTVADGTESDADQALDGTATVAFSQMTPLESGLIKAGPQAVEPGDVIVVLEPRTLEWFVVHIEKQ